MTTRRLKEYLVVLWYLTEKLGLSEEERNSVMQSDNRVVFKWLSKNQYQLEVITPTNHNRSKQGDEPIRIRGNYL